MSESHELLPWQEDIWRLLAPVVAEQRLAHALLLAGPPGVGKRRLASVLAHALLCRQPEADGRPCGACASCRQLAAGVHPDYTTLRPEEGKRNILIDQVRAFKHSLFLTPQYDSGRVGLIDPAEALNPNAANSLLKALEEPPAGSHILLISERPMAVMATIRSRCQTLPVPVPFTATVQPWLAQQPPAVAAALDLARGAPLRALALAEMDIASAQTRWIGTLNDLLCGQRDPVDIAGAWSKEPTDELLGWLYLCLLDVLKLTHGAGEAALANRGHAPTLRAVAECLDTDRVRRVVPRVLRTRRLLETNAETQLLLEQLTIDLLRCRRRTPRRIRA